MPFSRKSNRVKALPKRLDSNYVIVDKGMRNLPNNEKDLNKEPHLNDASKKRKICPSDPTTVCELNSSNISVPCSPNHQVSADTQIKSNRKRKRTSCPRPTVKKKVLSSKIGDTEHDSQNISVVSSSQLTAENQNDSVLHVNVLIEDSTVVEVSEKCNLQTSSDADDKFASESIIYGKREHYDNEETDGERIDGNQLGKSVGKPTFTESDVKHSVAKTVDSSSKNFQDHCINCHDKFIATSRSYRRFGLYSCCMRMEVSLAQMIASLYGDDHLLLRYENKNSRHNLKERKFLCHNCQSCLHRAYLSQKTMKSCMESFTDRTKSDSRENQSVVEDDVRDRLDPSDKQPSKNGADDLKSYDGKIGLLEKFVSSDYLQLIKEIVINPGGLEAFLSVLKAFICKEVNQYCRRKSGTLLLNQFTEESAMKFGWRQLQGEMEMHLPVLTTAVKSAVFAKCTIANACKILPEHRLEKNEHDFLRKIVCFGNLMASMMYINKPKMSFVQQANSVMMYYSGCSSWMLKVFHNLGLCVPAKTIKPFIDMRKMVQDIRMLKWRKSIFKPYRYMKLFVYRSGIASAKDIAVESGEKPRTELQPEGCKVVCIKGARTSIFVGNSAMHVQDSDVEEDDELVLHKLFEEKFSKERLDDDDGSCAKSTADKVLDCERALKRALRIMKGQEGPEDGMAPGRSVTDAIRHEKSYREESQIAAKPANVVNVEVAEKGEDILSFVKRTFIDDGNAMPVVHIISEDGTGERIKSIVDQSNIFQQETPHELLSQLQEAGDAITDVKSCSGHDDQVGDVMYVVMDDNQSAENIFLDLQQAGFTTST